MKIKWETYNPDWLVKIAEEKFPEETDIIDSIRKCITGFWRSPAYLYFVNPQNANEPESEWQFKDNIVIDDTEEGDIVLDILKDNRIGGIEFLKHVK